MERERGEIEREGGRTDGEKDWMLTFCYRVGPGCSTVQAKRTPIEDF